MRLQNELILDQARVTGIGIEPGEEDSKTTLAVRANLTRDVAEAFGCRDLIFAGNVPRSGVDKMALEGEEIDCTIHFKHDEMAFTAVANSIGHFVAKMEGDGPKLLFKIKLTGFATTAADLADKVRVDPLEITLKPAQRDLGLVDAPAEKEEGEQIDDSERLISPEQAADTAQADQDNAPLASVVVMGGSHQKGNKKKHGGRNPQPEVIDAETEAVPAGAADDFMADLEVVVQ